MIKKFLFLLPFLLQANILSPLENALIEKDTNKAKVSGDKLKNSWINPITLQYKYNQTNQTPTLQKTNQFMISINQPIFKSGAIYNSIKYAEYLKSENLDKIKLQKNQLIKNAYETLFNIRKINISIEKQLYLIANAKIDIKRKKEQFLSGVIDSSFLDNAIINKNNLEIALNDLYSQKTTLINNFKNLSNLDYKKVKLPNFKLISKKEYLKNLNLKIAKKDIKVKKALKYKNIGNSLLSINFIANYNNIDTKYNNPSLIYKDDSNNFYNLGISVTLPLDINSFKTVEESKIDYLKSVLNYEQTKLQETNKYNNEITKIRNIDKKIKIYQNSIKTYESLINTTKDNVKAGINTILDLETLQNTQKINRLNIESLKFDKQIEILELYYEMDYD